RISTPTTLPRARVWLLGPPRTWCLVATRAHTHRIDTGAAADAVEWAANPTAHGELCEPGGPAPGLAPRTGDNNYPGQPCDIPKPHTQHRRSAPRQALRNPRRCHNAKNL